MARIGIEHNGVFICAMNIPGRYKPCLVVERGNEAIVLGTFKNVEMVKEFEKALRELLGQVEE